MTKRICYFLGTYEDWGGASRALLNFITRVDRDAFEPLVVLSRKGSLLAQLERDGIGTTIVPKRDWDGNPFRFLLSIIDSILFFRKHRIDLIHCNGGALGWKPPELIAAWIMRIPVLMHFHITTARPTPFLKYVRGVIVVSKSVSENSDFRSKPVTVLHNIADLDRFAHGHSIRPELNFNPDDLVIGFLGQVKRIKGVDLFLRLPSAISDSNVRFLIAGEIKDKDDEFRAWFDKSLSADPRIKYVGYRTDPENLYATADILVMPSQWEEPCAMVLFESAAARKPIVASRTGGTPEIITHNENGLLFDKADFDQLVGHVRRLLDDPAERARIGSTSREVVDKNFTLKPVRDLERLYTRVLGG